MKFFTEEWCFSQLDDIVIEDVYEQYKQHINKIYSQLPFTLKLMVRNINLHDGIVKKVIFDKLQNSFSIYGVFGDLDTGYFFLEIEYLKVSDLDEDFLKNIFKKQVVEILSDEIEIKSDRFSHKFLFSSKKEFEIIFSNQKIYVQNANASNYSTTKCELKIL